MSRSVNKLLTSLFFSLGLLWATHLLAKDDAQISFAKQKIQVGSKSIVVEIADEPVKLSRGLMFRRSMPADEGMLFIFETEEPRSFWMKNTFIPLSIAFANAAGVIVDIQDMSPVKSEMETSPPTYVSAKPAKYALEMNQGWFLQNQIKVGDHLNLSKNLKKKTSK